MSEGQNPELGIGETDEMERKVLFNAARWSGGAVTVHENKVTRLGG